MKTLGDVGAGHTLGRYELLVPIAKGGMAVVWAARLKGSRGFQKIVAVKAMLPNLSDDPQFEEMFLAEAELASQIRHPHVCEILDLGEQDGVLFIVMEWIDGEPLNVLQKVARAKGDVPIAIATRIGIHAAQGLHSAHELKNETGDLVGLVHRDVSPQNILVTYDGVVKIVDFGVAKSTGRAERLTAAGQMKGKVTYMAPEQADGGEVDRRTDVFALGIVLYQLVTGKHPFKGDNDLATLKRVCDPAPVQAASSIVPRITPALNAAIMRALEKDPSRRFASMSEFANALESSLAKMVSHGADLGTFVRGLVDDRAVKKRAVIKEAQKLADQRTERMLALGASSIIDSGPTSGVGLSLHLPELSGVSQISTLSGPPSSRSGVSDVTGPSGLIAGPMSERTLTSEGSGQRTTDSGVGSRPSAEPAGVPSRPGKGKTWLVVVAIGAVAAGVGGLMFSQQRGISALAAPPAAPKSDGSAAQAAQTATAKATAAPVETADAAVATATASATAPAARRPRGPVQHAAPHAAPAAPPAAAPNPPGNVPQILNPGF